MSARRNLILNVVIQTLGAASSFVVIAGLARVAGPAVQGEYAVYKSLVDVQVALLTLGLPSGFVYVVNKGLIPGAVLAKWSTRGLPLFLFASSTITFAYLALRSGEPSRSLATTTALLALAVAATTFYALMRGIVLTQTDGAGFAWLSALPPISLMVLAILGVALGTWSLAVSFAASALLAAVAAVALRRRTAIRQPVADAGPAAWTTLRKQSFHSFLQGLFQSGAIFATIAMMQVLGAGVVDVGHFNVASLAVVGPNLLVAMIAPVLYSRWTRTLTRSTRGPLVGRALRIAVGMQVLALGLVPVIAPLLAFLLGEDYRPAAVAMVPLLLAVLPLAATRVIAPALQATGDTAVATFSWGVRLAAPVALAPLVLVVDDVVLWATTVTAIGEYVALAIMLVMAQRRVRLGPP
jgi:O-antigen/teichoic acid export membrane protein